jgi:hypothetical protein
VSPCGGPRENNKISKKSHVPSNDEQLRLPGSSIEDQGSEASSTRTTTIGARISAMNP